jgi:DNA-binding NarL/FixJ family response regulator
VIRVLLVDDQELVRTGFSMILDAQDDIEVVGACGDGSEAIPAVAELAPDVILMDVRMPGIDGIEATRQIVAGRTDDSGPRILVLTTFDLDEYVYDALNAGASGFLLKDAPAADLVAAIHTIARGDVLLAPSVTRRMIEQLAGRRKSAHPAKSALTTLTEKENEVLLLVARGLSNAEIGERIYVSEATVKTHVGHVLQKLGLRDRVQAVVLAYEAGVVLPGES